MKKRAVDIWKEMTPTGLRQLALAVFFMFGTFGPLLILMESELKILSWSFIVIQTLTSGGMAASIILFGRNRWWVITLVVIFWIGVLILNSGGASFVFDDGGRFRVQLQGPNDLAPIDADTNTLTIPAEELDSLYTQRGIIGVIAIGLLVTGYVLFIRVIRREVAGRIRLETEIHIAREIQQSLLPDSYLKTRSYEISGVTLPATEIGGDFFDIIRLPNDGIAVAMADVTGHGVGAGILSAMTKSALHSQLAHDSAPARVLTNLNRTIYQLSTEKMFVTFAYLFLKDDTTTVHLATAGHPPILLSSSGTVKELRSPNFGLGIRREAEFGSIEVAIGRGDTLLLYTDGVVEAMNSKGEQYGMDRLKEELERSVATTQELCAGIVRSVRVFGGSDSFTDDVSVVCIRRT